MFLVLALATVLQHVPQASQTPVPQLPTLCGQPASKTEIIDPPEIRSRDGFVNVTLTVEGRRTPKRLQTMCYSYQLQTKTGPQTYTVPPTLHLFQGEHIVLTLVNDMLEPIQRDDAQAAPALSIDKSSMDGMDDSDGTLMCGQPQLAPTPTPDAITGRIYGYHRSPWNEENMHFHGLNTSPKAPSDDVVNVLICPRKTRTQGPNSYTFVVDIPRDEPPGLYWYHPHPHGESEHQVQRGLTGAIIIDPLVAGPPQQMKNRVIIVRDFREKGTGAVEAADRNTRLKQTAGMAPDLNEIRRQVYEGISEYNVGSDVMKDPFGRPYQCLKPGTTNTKGLSINEIPLPLGIIDSAFNSEPHTSIPAGETQFWRLANTGSDTVLDIELASKHAVVPIQVVSRDGVPLISKNGQPTWQAVPMNHIIIPPAGRVEFYLTGTTAGDRLVMHTRAFDAGCVGDTEFERTLFIVNVAPASKTAQRIHPPTAVDPVRTRFSDLANATPITHRVFAFTEYPRSDEPEPDFYITQISDPNAVETPYQMHLKPAVVVKNGTVEDWTILNYTQEVHEFHIHQIHFLALQADGIAGGQGQLLDTIDVPFAVFKGKSHGAHDMIPGMVKLRMDFRGSNILGTFVYHCHILEHEDNGMMQKIQVVR